jgi:polysaccharide biosynthesis transport protein
MLQVLKDEAGTIGGGGSPFGFDPLALVALFRRRLKLFLITLLAIFVAVVGYAMQLTPRYTASADVLIDTRRTAALNIEAVMSGLPSDTNSVDTQVQILTSRSLAERVVRKLRLQEDPEFNPALDARPSLVARVAPGADAPAPQRPNPNSQAVIDQTVCRACGSSGPA